MATKEKISDECHKFLEINLSHLYLEKENKWK